MKCSQCGNDVVQDKVFCPQCNSVIPESQITEDDLAFFIGDDAEHYLKKWKKVDSGKRTWNWMAFLFAAFWFGYRKMYGYLFVYLVLFSVIDIIHNVWLTEVDQSPFVLALTLAVGLYGNPLYYRFAKQKIRKIKAKESDFVKQQFLIRKAGGTHWVGFGIAAVAIFTTSLITRVVILLLQQ